MGTIYKRGQTYWVKYYRNSKPFHESTGSTKETDAKRLLRSREGEISQGNLPAIYFDKVQFDELAEDFLTDYRVNQRKSLARAERSVGHLKEFFSGYHVTQITTPRIQAYIEDRITNGVAIVSSQCSRECSTQQLSKLHLKLIESLISLCSKRITRVKDSSSIVILWPLETPYPLT